MTVSPAALAALVLVALLAGTVDAIAGGGGLLTVPALLAAGLPAHLALGTNKGQSVWGSGAAMIAFARAGKLDRARARVTLPGGFVGSVGGSALVLGVPPAALKPVVLALLVGVAGFFAFRRSGSPALRRVAWKNPRLVAAVLALVIGTYDGFFGPGTGTFLIVGFTVLLGSTLTEASADAKVVNFASNLAAVVVFGAKGTILWQIALPMAAAQLAGGSLGAHLAVRGGDRVVRRVVLGVVTVLVAKLAWDLVVRR